MPHGEPKPTAKTIDDLATHLLAIWETTHKEWDTKLSYYDGTFPLWPEHLTKLRPSFHPPTATSKIDGAVNSLLAVIPQVHRITSGGKREEARGDKIEPWMSAILEATAQGQPIPHIRQSKQNLMLLGWTVLEGPTLDNATPPEEPKRKASEGEEAWKLRDRRWEHERKQWMPFEITVPVPKTVLLDPFEGVPQVAVKKGRWYAKDLEALLEKKKSRKYFETEVLDFITQGSKNPYEQVPCEEYWTIYWHAMKGPQGILFVEENIPGFIPFSHCFSGWGQSYTGWKATEDNDFSWAIKAMSRGLLDGLFETLKLEAQGMTGLHEALIRAGMQKLVTPKPAHEVAEQAEGDIIGDTDPDDLKWLADPGVQAHVFQTIEGYGRKIDEHTFPSVLVGIRPEGLTTVGSHALLRKDAGSKFAPPMQAMGQMYTKVGRNILRLVDVLDEEITAGGETIGPEAIQGNYAIDITFESSDPIIKFQEQEQARADVKEGLMSRETYFAIKGQEDATGEDRRILEDAVMRSPRVQELLATVVEQGLGLADLRAQVAQLQGIPGGAPRISHQLLGADGQPINSGTPLGAVPTPEGSPQEAESVAAGMERLMGGM